MKLMLLINSLFLFVINASAQNNARAMGNSVGRILAYVLIVIVIIAIIRRFRRKK